MPARLQINLLVDSHVVEHWKYYPEEDCWRDELGIVCMSTEELLKKDLNYAVEHFISIINGTHG